MTHAFDEATQSPGSKFVYNPEAAAKSAQLFQDFIGQQVARLPAEPRARSRRDRF